jgi:hypothetical protein
MQLSLCLNVGLMRSLWRFKDAKIRALALTDDTSNKPAWMPYYAKQSSRARALGRVLVFGIRSPADLAQVGKGIVGLVAVYVVNLLRRPYASHIQKSKLVRHRTKATKHDVNISIASQRPGKHPSLLASVRMKVCEFTGLWAVMRKLAQALLSDHVAPHRSGKSSEIAASGDESPVPRRVSCHAILQVVFAKSSDCGTIKALSRPGHQQLTRLRMKK